MEFIEEIQYIISLTGDFPALTLYTFKYFTKKLTKKVSEIKTSVASYLNAAHGHFFDF